MTISLTLARSQSARSLVLEMAECTSNRVLTAHLEAKSEEQISATRPGWLSDFAETQAQATVNQLKAELNPRLASLEVRVADMSKQQVVWQRQPEKHQEEQNN